MTPGDIERVFGRGRLKMVTGEHVEVFREAVLPGERRRYTKRFLNTRQGDFGHWTEREWRILARLVGHGIACVPEVVQYDRGRRGGVQMVQTYDAGVTVDQWATLLPVVRDGRVHGRVFEDCAHWWALAHHSLVALNEIHSLELVHLDVKGDNVCIPYAPASFDPHSSDPRLQPVYRELALIDFAFALISRESLTTPLPIGWQRDYDYQSPRLLAALEAGRAGDLQATRELDWRCDMYSLAAMLKRYLPDEGFVLEPALPARWTRERYDAANALILRLRDAHDGELSRERPHRELIAMTGAKMAEAELADSLERGWMLAREASVSATPVSLATPATLLAPAVHVVRSGRGTPVTVLAKPNAAAPKPRTVPEAVELSSGLPPASQRSRAPRSRRPTALAAIVAVVAVGATAAYLAERMRPSETTPAGAYAGDIDRQMPQGDPEPSTPASAPLQEPAASAERSPATLEREPSGAPPAADSVASGASAGPDSAGKAGSAAAPSDRMASGGPRPPAKPARAPATAPATGAAAAAPRSPTATGTATTATAAPAVPRRQLPSWVSLEPPAWLRTGRAPTPPGASAHDSRAPTLALQTPRTEPAPAPATVLAAVPATVPPTTLSAPAMVPAPATVAAGAVPSATSATQAAAAPSEQRKRSTVATLKRWLFGTSSAAPIEDRSESRKPTLASVDTGIRTPRVADNSDAPRAPSRADSGELARSPARAVETLPAPSGADNVNASAPLDYVARGRRTVTEIVPRVAAIAETEVSRVLRLAASAQTPAQDRIVAETARATRIADADVAIDTSAGAPSEARRLNDEALAVWASRRNVSEAFKLQLQAFGANPRDPEVAGNLALYYLWLTPPQPDKARQLALFALTVRNPEFHTTRMEDWTTFAIASALTGREADATRALFVTLALSGNVERRCAAALDTLAGYGERMRVPVEAMLARVRTQGRGSDSPACSWPAGWTVRRLS